jgi:hypothetical protein
MSISEKFGAPPARRVIHTPAVYSRWTEVDLAHTDPEPGELDLANDHEEHTMSTDPDDAALADAYARRWWGHQATPAVKGTVTDPPAAAAYTEQWQASLPEHPDPAEAWTVTPESPRDEMMRDQMLAIADRQWPHVRRQSAAYRQTDGPRADGYTGAGRANGARATWASGDPILDRTGQPMYTGQPVSEGRTVYRGQVGAATAELLDRARRQGFGIDTDPRRRPA